MRITRLTAAAVLLAPLAASCDLTSGATATGSDGAKAGQAAGAVLRLQLNHGKDLALKEYDLTVVWSGELVSEAGTGAGNTAPFEVKKTYQGKLDGDGTAVVTQPVSGEQAGTWRFTALTEGWTGECVRVLPAGGSVTVNWTAFRTGCGDGTVFP